MEDLLVDRLLFFLFVLILGFEAWLFRGASFKASRFLMVAGRVNWLRPEELSFGIVRDLLGLGGFSRPSRQQKCLQLLISTYRINCI